MNRLAARLGATLASMAAAIAAVALVAPPARAAPRPAGPVLVSQSPWVDRGGVWQLEVALPATDSGDNLQVAISARLSSRSAFDAAAAGAQAAPIYYSVQAVASLPRAPDGRGVLVRVPVDPAVAPKGGARPFYTGSALSGVYPVSVGMFTPAGVPVGSSLPTFVVEYSGGGFAPIDVAVTVPVGAAPTLRRGRPVAASPAAASAIGERVAAIRAAGVPVSLGVVPQTADALALGGASGRQVDGDLAGLVTAGSELLPAPYVPVSFPALEGSGLGSTVGAELRSGGEALAARLGTRPAGTAWVVAAGGLDPASAAALAGGGMRQLVVPGQQLSSLPSALSATTYGRPARLAGAPGVEVLGADPVLDGRLAGRGPPVLAAEQDLAELAMIQLETPSVRRGVAVIVPANAPAAQISTLLGGLAANPFAHAVTVAGLFAALPPATRRSPAQRLLAAPATPLPDSAGLSGLDRELASVARMLPASRALIGRFRQQLLVAEADGLARAARVAAVGSDQTAIDRVTGGVTLPGAASVTLTSRQASIPVTIDSIPGLAVHVQLQLSSAKLAFRSLRPPGGSCQASAGTERCALVLRAPLTTFRVPVEARSSGVFPLVVTLRSPDGAVLLAGRRDTVRSTAASFVGLVLMGTALLFLAAWWVRNARHGRRARALVPRPGDDPGDDRDGGEGPGPGGGGGGAHPGPAPPDGAGERPGPLPPAPGDGRPVVVAPREPVLAPADAG